MLGKYIKVNGVSYPNPYKFKIGYSNNEVVNLSEAFTELVSVNRLLKFEADFTFQVTSNWMTKILSDCSEATVTLTVDSVDHVGRLRCKSCDLEQNSENVRGTDGLWTIKVSFTEL